MVFAFNFALDNPAQAQAFAQMCAIATTAGVGFAPVGAGIAPVPTPAQATPAPAPAPKVYAPATDVACKWVVDKCNVTYTLEDGKYVGQTGARKTLNARLKQAGATYDATRKVWHFATSKKAQEFADNTSASVSAQEIEQVRAKAAERKARKAQ